MLLSKFGRICRPCVKTLLMVRPSPGMPVRRSAFVPPTQYDTPMSRKFHMTYVLKEYWETIPLFVTTVISIVLVVAIIVWDVFNKVDLVFTPYSRNNISRTMDLRNPTVHKCIVINQRYAPWPEMQDVLDKMKAAEKRLLSRAQNCGVTTSS